MTKRSQQGQQQNAMSTANKTVKGVDMSAYWLPFTPNRYFHQHPKIMRSAKGAYYFDDHNRKLFDGLSGLWCSPLGHDDPRIGAAISKQYETMDYCPAFQMASEATFSLASRIADMAPRGLDKVFFTNSGSEAVDTALTFRRQRRGLAPASVAVERLP